MDITNITLREIVQSSSVSNTMKDGHKTSKRWFGQETLKSAVERMVLEILDPKGPILEKWNLIFVISCLFAVLLDPLFLYVPLINQDVKCIALDKRLKIAAVLFRSITDFIYIVKIIFQIYELKKVTVLAIWRTHILLDIFAILPVPQVTILGYFTKMRGSRSLNTRKILNFLVLIQYVPRVLRIYFACKEIKNSPQGKLGLWIKGGLNFLMYIFASHILGSFWYFFSVQRMIACWQYACRDEDGCKPSTFNCQDRRTNDDSKLLLNDSCPINPSNETIFDFGIFLDALQSGLVGSTDYSQKLSNCFWWGLRNLSSLGSDLHPSINTWENLFAALTSIIGLLLFLYLIGNLQMYMQLETASKEQLRWKIELKNMMRTERKIRTERSKGPEVAQWLSRNELPTRFMTEIMETVVQVELEHNRDVNVEKIFPILPLQLQEEISIYKKNLEQEGGKIELWLSENRLPMRLKSEVIDAMAQRPDFEQNGISDVNNVLIMLPPQLKVYIENYMQKVREKDEEIGSWLSENELPEALKSDIMETVLENLENNKEDVVVENILLILPVPLRERISEYMRLRKIKRKLEEKDDEIGLWVLKNGLPKWRTSEIKLAVYEELNKDADTDVQSFLYVYGRTQKWIQKFLPFNRLKKVKLLKTLDERVLKAICKRLKPVEYDRGTLIIQEGQPLEMILFVEAGIYSEKRRGFFRSQRLWDHELLLWGEELLVWPSSTSFPAELLRATDTLSAGDVSSDCGETRALVLTATDMKSIGSKFKPQFDKLTSDWLTRLKKVPKLRYMDKEVLKAIFLHLKQDLNPLYSLDWSLYNYVENEPVVSMNFIIEGSVEFKRNGNVCEELLRNEGEVYGEELLDWVLDTSFPTLTPFATHTAIYDRANPSVQLSITAAELKSVGSKFRSYFSTLQKESHHRPDLVTVVGLTVLKKVPKLKTMDEEVLKAISQHLKFKEYVEPEEIIVTEKSPIDRMLFLLNGMLYVWKLDEPFLGEVQLDSFEYCNRNAKDAGPFLGEELIDWLATGSDGTRPLSECKVTTGYTKTRLLVLMANDLESVMSNYKSHFI